MVQWLRLHTSNAGGTASIPGWGAKIQHTAGSGPKNKSINKIAYSQALLQKQKKEKKKTTKAVEVRDV